MPKLKYTNRTFRVIDYADWNDFIKEVYGLSNYNIVADEDLRNDEYYKFHAECCKVDDYDEEELAKFVKFLNGELVTHMTFILMRDLCNRGLITESEYLITVSYQC